MKATTKRGPTESTNPAAETANRTTVESTTPKPTATKAASAKTTAVSPAKTAVSTTAVSTTAATGRCNCWGKSDRCTDCGGYGKSDDCFSNHHGKSPRWNDIPRQRQP
jgi:hypothetical protein